MLFFFPLGTDAPVYYWPITTVAMIAINVLVFAETVANPELADSLVLHFGQFNPVEWITSAFVHGNLMHILGNMIFFWTFGLIVEGKLGWRKTLYVYLGISAAQCAVEQILMLGRHVGCSFGASAIVYGIMAMSMVWAPENRVRCVWGWWFITGQIDKIEIRVRDLAACLLTYELIILFFSGVAMSTELLHLMGAAAGGAIAVWMLKTGKVDCENWDWFSVRAGRHKTTPDELAQNEARNEDPQKVEEERSRRVENSLRQIREIIRQGQPMLAWKANDRMARELPGWSLPEEELAALIASFHHKNLRVESIPAMAEYLAQFPLRSVAMRLKLAEILIADQRRPAQALKVLKKIPETSLDAAGQAQLAKLRTEAERIHAEDPYEIADDDW